MRYKKYNPNLKEYICRICKINKPIDQFSFNGKENKQGVKYRNLFCKDCHNKYKKAYWQKNKNKFLARGLIYQKTPIGRWYVYRVQSKRKQHSFELTKEQFLDIIKRPCYYCGTTPSNGIDRIDSNEGYLVVNSLPCCGDCNRGKFTNSASYFINHCRKVVQHQEVI